MKSSLYIGLIHKIVRHIETRYTVPALFPDDPDASGMPPILSSAFLVGLCELACVEMIRDHLEPGQGSVGVQIDLQQNAPAVEGARLTLTATLAAIDGRRLEFTIRADDGADIVGEARHVRVLVDWQKTMDRLRAKVEAASAS